MAFDLEPDLLSLDVPAAGIAVIVGANDSSYVRQAPPAIAGEEAWLRELAVDRPPRDWYGAATIARRAATSPRPSSPYSSARPTKPKPHANWTTNESPSNDTSLLP